MKAIAFILIIAVLPILGFSQQTIYGSITHDGMDREYILYVPANYTGAYSVPLILNYHGYGSNAFEQMNYGDFRPIADTGGFLVIHPQGSLHFGIPHWNVGGWTIGSTTDDVGFTAALIDSIAAEYNIDLSRVYSTGMSNGGFMSFLLACQLSDEIAAIASVTGSMTLETYGACSPARPVPIMQIHGTDDSVVPYTGSLIFKSVDQVVEYWVDYNNCNPTPVFTLLPDIDPNDGSTVELYVYDEGDNNATVEHYKVIGGEHTWPGNAIGGPGTNYDINASVEIWNFFSRYDLNGITGIDVPIGIGQEVVIYPNPARSFVNVESGGSDRTEYELVSSMGKIIEQGVVNKGNNIIDLSKFTPGIYFLRIGQASYKIVKME